MPWLTNTTKKSLKLIKSETYYTKSNPPHFFPPTKYAMVPQYGPFSLHTMLEGLWLHITAFPTHMVRPLDESQGSSPLQGHGSWLMCDVALSLLSLYCVWQPRRVSIPCALWQKARSCPLLNQCLRMLELVVFGDFICGCYLFIHFF